MEVYFTIASVILVSLISIVAALPFLIKKRVSKWALMFLLSMSVGVLMGTVFLDFLPEAFTHKEGVWVASFAMAGFLLMFLLEKFVHWHHHEKSDTKDYGHSHAYSLAPLNLFGDGLHNFIDGLVIAGSYAINIPLGLAATISIIFHEVPQEIADFGVLLYSGMSKKKALFFNFLSALTALLGAILGMVLSSSVHGFEEMLIPFAAGNFIYIAASNLLPQLHRGCDWKDTFLHLLAIILGFGVIVLLTVYGSGHG